MCPNQEIKTIRPIIMSEETINRILMDIKFNKDNVQQVLPFIYGEPLLFPGIFSLLKELFEILGEYRTVIYTNGSLLEGELALTMKNYIEYGYCYLVFSVDGYYNYEKVRLGLSRQRVYDNIINFIHSLSPTAKTKIRVEMCVGKMNQSDLDDFMRFWDKEGVTYNAAYMDGRFDPLLSFTKPDYKLPCKVLWETIYILSNGNVTPCCIDWRGENNFGNIQDKSIREIWNGKEYQQIRRLHIEARRNENTVCARCDRNLG